MTKKIEKDSSEQEQFISFVLPVYNEKDNLQELYDRITKIMKTQTYRYELLFIDDGSSDDSFDVLKEIYKKDIRVRVIQFRRNFGKAAAYNAGFQNAKGDIIITMDTDLQDEPEEIPLFIDKMKEGFDLVTGWKHEGKGPLTKSLPSKIFNRVVSFITGIRIHDFNCPFKAYRKEVLKEIEIYGELHRYIPVLARSKGFSIAEIKIKNLPRKYGQSKYGIERFIRGMLDLLTVIFITRFAKRPLHFLGIGGLFSSLAGLAILLFYICAHFLYKAGILISRGWNIHDRPAISLGLLLMIVGIQFFSIGLIAELIVSSKRISLSDSGYTIRKVLGD
ncbi:MAG: glycosyl transferase family 2 [Candidatus Schekmanbacteria bacterium RBG_13_48_7]|uniref:Glycosyl transferase family 2 n=1 Tax=Candidatus Schekmanbacteria bacterium RBG_13_48_7 TaxID=1817878 RepID=A0A1F7RW10_9BACT|nr:MAG: glycosyl transferase family 2 [Candidatus Schekmanbacteria bacterium RBG_13_48_7]